MVLSVEELLPKHLRRRFTIDERTVQLVEKKELNFSSRSWRKIEYMFWGGEYYDTNDAVNQMLSCEVCNCILDICT